MTYPETSAQRRAGMAAFRARMLKAHKVALLAAKTPRDAKFQRDMIAAIEAAQARFGER